MKVSFFNQLYIVLCTASLISCANIIPSEESSKVIVPELHISIPEWPDNLGFWSGVKTETLVWKSKERGGNTDPSRRMAALRCRSIHRWRVVLRGQE